MRRPSALVALFLGALLLLLSPPPALAAGSPTASFAKTSTWDGGYQGAYTLTNGGTTTVSAWTVEFDLPSGTTVGSYWDALLTQSGSHYTFKNREYNGSLAPGASTTFGWVSSGTGTPANCRLNGAPCTGGSGGGDTTRPACPAG
ncbi:cellulose binding domain-containing protein [Streptomyces diastatochromogenes]|nr:cellulose binding domain-containing protein [Streptomyces diastatochromogenes]